MFEAGRYYQITTGIGDGSGYSTSKVLAWDHPLLKIQTPTGEEILNTSAPYFVSAKISERRD